MHTHYLGAEEVNGYCKDLISRLEDLRDCAPSVFCPIGHSGDVLATRIFQLAPHLAEQALILTLDYDRDSCKVTSRDGTIADDVPGRSVIVLDSSVHSGVTMAKVVEAVSAAKPKALCTYSLVIKRSTAFVPSFWGVTINDHDRAYFLLERLPNNRLNSGNPFFQIRKLRQTDLKKPLVVAKQGSPDRITWFDRYYNMETRGREHVSYVLEVCDQIVGYVSLSYRGMSLDIDEVAVDTSARGKGFGGALMRWAETCARQACTQDVRLWAITSLVPMYGNLGYKKVDRVLELEDGMYHLMTKRVLYHI